jgi:dTDP-4-dehydrorhamnose reductase
MEPKKAASKALVTGGSGTVGARLRQRLQQQGVEVQTWDRSRVPVDDYWRMEAYVRETAPDVLFHLAIASKPTGRENEGWLVNYEWPSELAWITRQLGVRFVFTSTAMVFSDNARGPFTLASEPDASEGYGYQKRRAEERVLHQNPEARVVRLGWQIDDRPEGNTMTAALETQMREGGVIRASHRWYPACAFLDDTAAALSRAASEPPGIYMADSNERWTHFEIAEALSARIGRGWRVEPTSDFIYDQRLIDARLDMPSLKERLEALP